MNRTSATGMQLAVPAGTSMRSNPASNGWGRVKTTGSEPASMVIGRKYAGRLTPDDVAAAGRVLAAVWCRSVGTSWTLEFH